MVQELRDSKDNEVYDHFSSYIIGITGSIGSGKTTVAKLFKKHDYNKIDADEIGHKIIRKNSAAYKKIIKKFGSKISDKSKNIDRTRLGDLVFGNVKKLKKLNSILHPLIIKEIKIQIKKIKDKCQDETKIVIDAPLLLETKTKNFVDKIIVVKCDKKNIFKRLSKKYPKEKIERILKSQMPLNKKLKFADFVIDNNKDVGNLEKEVDKIIVRLSHK